MTSRTIRVNLAGLDASVTISHGVNTSSAYGLTFNEDALVIAETDSLRFSGYCDAEIAHSVLGDMLATRRRIEYEDIADALDAQGLICECEE